MNKKKPLLLISDNIIGSTSDITLLQDVLQEMSLELVICAQNDELHSHISQHQPTLVLIDEAHLPLSTELTGQRRLLLTKNTDPSFLSEQVSSGISDFLFKPLQKPLIINRIEQQIALVEQQQTSARLTRQTLKLKELGELVGLVSHEVASPLGNVNTAVSFLVESSAAIRQSFDDKKLAGPDLDKFLKRLQKALSMCVKNGANAGGIIGSFRNVATNLCLENLNQFYLHRYLDDIVLTLKSKLKKLPHEIHIVVSEAVEMTSYSGAFAQVVNSLINKSIIHGFEASKPGKIIINASMDTDEKGQSAVIINYSDNGKGMDEQTLSNLLTRDETNNPEQTKNGLTMTMLKKIVEEQLCGTMAVTSKVGEGIHCTLTLPQRVEA
jgi:two-component system NtrC family sensor kinase